MIPIPRLQRLAAVGAVWLLGASPLLAHRLDECLQASFVSVEPGRIGLSLSLTPGVEVADGFLRTMDADGDGHLTNAEADAYAEKLKGDLNLRIDGKPLTLHSTKAVFPGLGELKEGQGMLAFEFSAAWSPDRSGPHRLVFENSHRTNVSVYIANALKPESPQVVIGRQERDFVQRRLAFDFEVMAAGQSPASAPKTFTRLWVLGGATALFFWIALGRTSRPHSNH
jgi:hypothetical protein